MSEAAKEPFKRTYRSCREEFNLASEDGSLGNPLRAKVLENGLDKSYRARRTLARSKNKTYIFSTGTVILSK